MDRIIKYKGFIQFVIFAIFLYGVYWIAIKPPYTAQKSYADLVEENTNDPSAPPIISSTMRDPSWSIRYWLDVDKKSSDCVMADEIMDKGGNVKILRKRGAVIKSIIWLTTFPLARTESIDPLKWWISVQKNGAILKIPTIGYKNCVQNGLIIKIFI